MIKNVNGRFDDYSVSSEIRQILFRWSYELVESDLLWFFFHMKMSYYWFNRQELLQKAKDWYYGGGGKEIAAEYYFENRYVLKVNARNI